MERDARTRMNPPTTDSHAEVDARCRAVLPPAVVEQIDRARQDERPRSHLISVLHSLQRHVGYLAREQLDAVAQLLQVPTSKVIGVATFYAFFRLKPRGRVMLNVCLGTACYVNGAQAILERLQDELGVEVGGTSKDGLFSLEATRCLGTCSMAPVLMAEERAHGKLKPEKMATLLAAYREKLRG